MIDASAAAAETPGRGITIVQKRTNTPHAGSAAPRQRTYYADFFTRTPRCRRKALTGVGGLWVGARGDADTVAVLLPKVLQTC